MENPAVRYNLVHIVIIDSTSIMGQALRSAGFTELMRRPYRNRGLESEQRNGCRPGFWRSTAGIPDYWIVNLPDGRIEVYRDPTQSSEARCGWIYRTVQHYAPGQHLASLAAPERTIAVDDLLP